MASTIRPDPEDGVVSGATDEDGVIHEVLGKQVTLWMTGDGDRVKDVPGDSLTPDVLASMEPVPGPENASRGG